MLKKMNTTMKMKNKKEGTMKKLYMYATATIIAMLPMIMLIAYMTYTEKIVLPIIMIIIIISLIKIRKEK